LNTLDRRAWILDVGHGNSTVVEDLGHVSVIDGGNGDTLCRFLENQGINYVETVMVSHADADHFGGISLMLSNEEFQVGQVFLNPDARDSKLWNDFLSVMIDAKQRGTKFQLELTDTNPQEIAFDKIRLEVLFPPQDLAYRTSSGPNPDGGRLTPNKLSAAVRVWTDEIPRLFLAGDIDRTALNRLTSSGVDMKADVLVFPHHGGRPGNADPQAFAKDLVNAVNPQLVVFSIGHGRYGMPRPEIINSVLEEKDATHIACTQLSAHCAGELPLDSDHIHAPISRGRTRNACCAGTLIISLDDEFTYFPDKKVHLDFIRRFAPTALCSSQISFPT